MSDSTKSMPISLLDVSALFEKMSAQLEETRKLHGDIRQIQAFLQAHDTLEARLEELSTSLARVEAKLDLQAVSFKALETRVSNLERRQAAVERKLALEPKADIPLDDELRGRR